MEALSLHTGAPTVHWEDNKMFISVVEAKRVTPRLKQINIHVCLKKINGIFIQKYDKSSVMLADLCTQPCSGPIISRSTKSMNGFRFYPTSETEHYQLMRLHEFIVN